MVNSCRFIANDAMKKAIDQLCEQQRKTQGAHYAETVAALVLIGLKTVRKSGRIYPSVLREVSNGY